MPDLLRHISACNNAVLPGGRLPFRLSGMQVGWVQPGLGETLRQHGATLDKDGVGLSAGDLDAVTRSLASAGHFRWRGEAFDVRASPGGPALATIDRGALPAFGIAATGAHLNGLVQRPGGLWLWVARRAADKLLDPGKLDHIAAGGVPAGLTPLQTLVKEAGEEASIPPDMMQDAQPVAVLSYAMDRPEGLRRDRLHCYDLMLPESFVPRPADGEVEDFELWPLSQALDRARDTDDFKFNVNLVLIDLGLRRGILHGPEAQRLRSALDETAG